MDPSQQPPPALEFLRKIKQEVRQTKSLAELRRQFDELNVLRRRSIDDFDLQVAIADIHHEIVERALLLKDETQPALPAPRADHSVIFQAPVMPKSVDLIRLPKPAKAGLSRLPVPGAPGEKVAEDKETRKDDPTEAAEIPPEVTRVDAKSWQMIVGLAAFLCLIALVVFFYLIQTARKINLEEEAHAKTEQSAKSKTAPGSGAQPAPAPALRLYTDLTGGAVVFDDQPPRNLTDGEFLLDHLPPGDHSMKVTGTGGSASFQFHVTPGSAPQPVGVPQSSNALVVLVSEQDGRGQLVTSAGRSEVLLDGKSAGETSPASLELVGLGTIDHDLQVVHERDRQRFVMTYTPAPVLTVYVKSDANTGILQISTGEDDVEVYIQNTLFRRKTEHGQVRMSIRAGKYSIRVHKDGFMDPPPALVEIKKAEMAQLQFELLPAGNLAALRIRGAQAGTTAYIDREFVAAIGPDGAARILNIKPGEHIIELRHEQSAPKRIQRLFRAGEVITLAGSDVTLEKNAPEGKLTPAGAAAGESGRPANFGAAR